MSHRSRYTQRCVQCGQVLQRVRRQPEDAADPTMRRYRCASAGCGWQGLLPSLPRAARAEHLGRMTWAMWRPVAPLAVGACIGLATAAVVFKAVVFEDPPGPRQTMLAFGESFDGRELPVTHPLFTKVKLTADVAGDAASAPPRFQPLALRHSCAWGKPGRNPYKGTVEQALLTAALPIEVVQAIAAQVRAGQPVDQVIINNAGIRAQRSGREFSPRNIAMSYGMMMCLGTRVNFEPGHVERAALYEAADKDGRMVAVMIPEVCGNVSVLGQTARRSRELLNAAGPEETQRSMPALLTWDESSDVQYAQSEANTVPETGTLAYVLAGLACMALLSRARRR